MILASGEHRIRSLRVMWRIGNIRPLVCLRAGRVNPGLGPIWRLELRAWPVCLYVWRPQ